MNLLKINRFLFAALFATLAVSVWAQTGNRYALVIGNAEYQRIDKLKNTINDARDISAALQNLGYQVDLKLNLGHLQMVDAIETFTTKLAGNRANEGFFWYAGHAVQIQDENYLLPVDITVDTVNRVRAGSFSLNNLIDMLDTAKNKVNVLILDACRDNPLPTAGRGGGGRGLAMIRDVPSDLFVMFSTAPGNKADDGAAGKRNSPFAEAFLKHIKSNEPVYQMAIDVTQETLNITDQRQRPFQRGSIISEKYYSLNPQGGRSAQPTVQPTPQPAPQPASRPSPTTGNAKEHFDKGNLFYDRDDYDTAILEFNEAIRIDPNYKEAYLYRGISYLEGKNDSDNAIADFTQAIRIDPNYMEVYFARGYIYGVNSENDKAIEDFTQAIRLDPNNSGLYLYRGNIYFIKKDYDKAITDYNQAIRLDPKNASTIIKRGNAYFNKQDYDKAIADYNQAIRLDPKNAKYKQGLKIIQKRGRFTTFPTGFVGTWKRDNFNNTLTFDNNPFKVSNQDFTWILSDSKGNSYTFYEDNFPHSNSTITIKLVNGNLEISGDSGTGENNWNGIWKKQ
jgi:tetratricopeptide (TPR) repeat protein